MPETRALFLASGLRLTRQRRAILESLCACRSHPTAEELHRMVSPDCSMSLATVYNTLQALSEAGLCRKLPTTDGSCRYDGGCDEHVHLRIAGEGEALVDLPDDLSRRLLDRITPDLLAEVADAMGVEVDRVSIVVHGRSDGAGQRSD